MVLGVKFASRDDALRRCPSGLVRARETAEVLSAVTGVALDERLLRAADGDA